MGNFSEMEIGQSREDLKGEMREEGLVVQLGSFKGLAIDVFEQEMDVGTVIEHGVAFDQVGIVEGATDLQVPDDVRVALVVGGGGGGGNGF